MARKRKIKKVEDRGSSKRPCVDSPKPERNVLNDGLLSLYKKELELKKEKSLSSQDESFAGKSKENDKKASKTPSKAGKRSKLAALTPKISTVNCDNIGGLDEILTKILLLLRHYRVLPLYKEHNISPVTGILLHGPPGCGKTYIVRAIAGELGVPIIEVSATELVRGISGESESMIRDVFTGALATGRCILFMDEIDAICRKREVNENAMLGRMVTQMIKSFDELSEKDPDGNVVVIGATNMPDALDSALRRGSRFTHEIAIGMPDEKRRLEILKVICKDHLPPDFDFRWVAHHTPGYVGADLKALASLANIKALDRVTISVPLDQSRDDEVDFNKYPEAKPLSKVRKWLQNSEYSKKFICTLSDFKAARLEYVPSSKREGFASVPDTTWNEIGSYEDIKKQLQKNIMWPIQYSKLYEQNKFPSNKGILLYGPKGCGKTLLAKAIANECSINFLAVNGPELLNKYVGESERAVRTCFDRARNSAPCIIFFDEFDALCAPRSSSRESVAADRVVNQLLTESSGITGRKKVFLIAATNQLDKIDSAMLRPGRFDKVLYVGLPTPAGRVEILKSHLKEKALEEGFDIEKVAFDPRCEHFSGADISNLVGEAILEAVEEGTNSGKLDGMLPLCMKHFDQSLNKIQPSISEEERTYYEKISAKHTRRQK